MASAIDIAKVQELLASSRTRGVYGVRLKEDLLDTDEVGVEYSLKDGLFAGKKATSVKTGFETARKKLPESDQPNIKVFAEEDKVYVVHIPRAQAAAA